MYCVSFWFWREIGSFFVVAGNFYYDRKKRYSRLSGGYAIIITTGKKKIQSSVCWVRGSGDYDRKKKIQSSVWWVVLLYCVSFWFWREIGSFFVVAGNFYYHRKKSSSHLSDGCAIIITTGKKKIQSSVCWVCGSGDYDRKKKRHSRLGKFSLRPEKKKIHYDRKKKDTVVSGGKLAFFL